MQEKLENCFVYLKNTWCQSTDKKQNYCEQKSVTWAIEQETKGNCEQDEFQSHRFFPSKLFNGDNSQQNPRKFCQGGPK